MKRWSITNLEAWKKNAKRKPLLLLGARQVGKTWLMKEFGRLHYPKVVYIRFDNDPFIRQAFEQDYDVQRLLMALQLRSGIDIDANTLIILDEIQECPKALTALKYFCEEARHLSILAAGSLLGLEEHSGTGFPVGKVDRIYMYPMSYTEFLDACGYGMYVELLRRRDWKMIETFRPKFEEMLRYYYYVGGMPEAVAEFVDSQNMVEVRRLQESLLADYKNDFRKHASAAETHLITQIWNTIPELLANEDKRFMASAVESGIRAAKLRGPLRWLQDAGLTHTVSRVRTPEIPLDAYTDAVFKLFFLDVGLLSAKSKLPAALLLEQNNIFKQYKGALTEQYVLQQLLADCALEPFYWSAERAQAEIDFLLQLDGFPLPLEVKAERNLRAKSLHSFCKRFNSSLAIRSSMSPYELSSVDSGASAGPYTLVDIPLFAISTLVDEVKCHL